MINIAILLGLALAQVVFIVGGLVGWYLRKRYSIPKNESEFSIGIYEGTNPFSMSPSNKNPVITKEDVTDRKAAYVADPFMIKVKEMWYMFFEVRNSNSYLTELAYATSPDALTWTYQKVIQPDSHFQSYPYVFEWEGEYYMIPECHKSKSIRIYKAKNFPEEWVLDSVVAYGKRYVDPSIFRYDNKWWIFTSTTDNSILYLCYSDNLNGPWQEHPLSPITEGDKRKARPAGRVIEYQGNLYRFSQDCSKYYGEKVLAFKINKLSPTEYHEESVGTIIDKGTLGWNSKGMHTFDAHQVEEGKWLACVDGYKNKREDLNS